MFLGGLKANIWEEKIYLITTLNHLCSCSQKNIQNPVKHLRWTVLWRKTPILCLTGFSEYGFCSRLTLSWRRPISYRNQSIDLRSKSVDWFLYRIGLRHERVNVRTFLLRRFMWFFNFRSVCFCLFWF